MLGDDEGGGMGAKLFNPQDEGTGARIGKPFLKGLKQAGGSVW
jgi:hypothetical protein